MNGENRGAGRRFSAALTSLLIAAMAGVLLVGGCAHGPQTSPPPPVIADSTNVAPLPSAAAPAPRIKSDSANAAPLSPVAEEANREPDASPSSAFASEPGTPTGAGEISGEGDRDLEGDFIAGDDEWEADSNADSHEESLTIADPWEPFNRAMFNFNDKLYFWVLKPVARGYAKALPEGVRVSIRNVFVNIAFPVRFVNCFLQFDLHCAAVETGRFVINSVWGLGGLFDVASDEAINLPRQPRDLGQTLGVYGFGPGIFINWPIFGPSSPRDTIGLAGDIFLDPLAWVPPWYAATSIGAYYKLNDTSLSIGNYEALKEAAIDPYIALRDAYVQHRNHKIKGVTKQK